ncbi:MAG TPA: hypothetical protein VJV05_11095, partial [Pyrinomonadaceae bacterium]|nr:hypothetical protein [Pyrinomonadaceae bacterium]
MQNDVNNDAEVSTTGETAAVESNKQEQPAEAQAPVAATEEAATQAATATETAPEATSAPAERTEPRRVAKPPAPPVEEEKSGEIDFGAILERFEQE